MNEAWLIQRAQQGDQLAFGQLVALHERFVYNLALRTVRDPMEAEDLAQEAFIRIWRALPRFRGDSAFRTWLYRIVINLCCTRLPHLRQEIQALPIDEPEDGLNESSFEAQLAPDIERPTQPLDVVQNAERRAWIQNQVDALPESYRILIMLRFQQDLSYEEIAAILDMPLGTVKTGLFRARARLRDGLQAYEQSWFLPVDSHEVSR